MNEVSDAPVQERCPSPTTPNTTTRQVARQHMQQILYKLMQDRCSIEDPTNESQALERLLYRSTESESSNKKNVNSQMMDETSLVVLKLKGIGTKLLMRKLRKHGHKLGSFRTRMVLTQSVMTRTSSKLCSQRSRAAAGKTPSSSTQLPQRRRRDSSSCWQKMMQNVTLVEENEGADSAPSKALPSLDKDGSMSSPAYDDGGGSNEGGDISAVAAV